MCNNSTLLGTLAYIKFLLNVISVAAPLALILYFMIRLAKAIIEENTDIPALLKEAVLKIVATISVFGLVSIIAMVLSFVGGNTKSEFLKCFGQANTKQIEYYNAVEKIEHLLRDTSVVSTEENYDKALDAILEVYDIIGEDKAVDYIAKLSELDQQVHETTLKVECINKGGSYVNGVCEIIPLSLDVVGDNLIPYNFNGTSFLVVNTKIPVKKYYSEITAGRKKVNQMGNFTNGKAQYPDKCLAFAYIYAYSMYNGVDEFNCSANYCENLYKYAGKFRETPPRDNGIFYKRDFMKILYNELTAGKPVVVQVARGNSRHYVTIVGFKESISNVDMLKEDSFLYLNTYNGELNTTEKFITGRETGNGRNYGYQSYVLK